MAESITQDTAYRAVMEPKGYTVTIQSGKANGEVKTYIVNKNSSFVLPQYPFTPDPDSAFTCYSLRNVNGSTSRYFKGASVTVDRDMTFTCVLLKPSLQGKKIKIRFSRSGKSLGYSVLNYDPALEGMYYQFMCDVDSAGSNVIDYPILLNARNLNSYQDMSPALAGSVAFFQGALHRFGDGVHFEYGGNSDPNILFNTSGSVECTITCIVSV